MEELSLESFLRAEASLGEHAGEGRFLIDPAQALEKLSKFALPEPGLWVVKLVQAAVACGSDEIRFTFLRRHVKVDFFNQQGWEAEELLTVLMSGLPPEDAPGQRHFVTGILGAADGFTQRVSWSCGQTYVRVDDDGPVVEANTESPDQVLIQASRPAKPKTKISKFSPPVRHVLRQTAHEFMALVKHCRACSIPVYCDNYELPRSYECNTAELPTAEGYDAERPDGARKLLAQFPLLSLERGAKLAYPIAQQQLTDLEQPKQKFETLRLASPQKRVHAVCCIYLCLQRKSRLNFLMDGIVVERCELFFKAGAHPLIDLLLKTSNNNDLVLDVFVEVGWKDLDLTQFAIREKTKIRDQLLEQLPGPLSEVLKLLRRDCELPWALSSGPPPAKLPWSLGGILVTGVLTPFIPHFLVIGGIALCAMPIIYAAKPFTGGIQSYFHRKRWKPLAEHLDRAIEGLEDL